VAPVTPGGDFMFGALKPGAYTVRASAPGFEEASVPVTVPSSATLNLTMKVAAVKMPSIFGLELPTALATLKAAGINVARIVDVAGRDVAPANPGPEYNTAPVLAQLPVAGEFVTPSITAQLVVAAALVAEAAIEMPSLVGLTQAEAQKALENIGLVLGKVLIKQPPPIIG
jgi:beta-lactam-binding protein with PASTA domain